MAEQRDSEAIMRASLAAIDGIRARITWGGYAAVAATLGAFWWLDHVASTSTSTNRLVMAAVLAMTCVVAWSTFAMAIFVTRMTKRILRAIDLAAKTY